MIGLSSVGLLDLEAVELADVGDILAQGAQVLGLVVEVLNVVAPGRARVGFEVGENGAPGGGADVGRLRGLLIDVQSTGVVLPAWSTPKGEVDRRPRSSNRC